MAAMNLRTLGSLIGSGQVPFLFSLMLEMRCYHRLAFVGAALSSGLLRRPRTRVVMRSRDVPVGPIKQLGAASVLAFVPIGGPFRCL